jgi:hypothetical protein
MTQYIPGAYQNPPADTRSRGSSNASVNKYTPDKYPPAPPQQQGCPASAARPRGPSIGDEQITSIPPSKQTGSYGPPPVEPVPQSQFQPLYPSPPRYNPQGVKNDGYMRPSADPRRRFSVSSTHSRHSHDSHRSHRSRRSFSSRERERRRHEHDKKHHSHHHGHDKREHESPKRVNTHRPTLGDTLFGMFDAIRCALGPRDKH